MRRPAAAGGRAGRRLLRVLLKIDGHGDSSEMIHGRRAATHGNDNGGLAESARPTSAALKDVIQWASEGAPGRMVATWPSQAVTLGIVAGNPGRMAETKVSMGMTREASKGGPGRMVETATFLDMIQEASKEVPGRMVETATFPGKIQEVSKEVPGRMVETVTPVGVILDTINTGAAARAKVQT